MHKYCVDNKVNNLNEHLKQLGYKHLTIEIYLKDGLQKLTPDKINELAKC